MNKLVDDLSALTTISQHALVNLVEKSISCICHSVCEALLDGNNLVEMDIGVGTLYIKCEDDQIKYKFIPSKKLEESVAFTVNNKISPVEVKVETVLKNRIETTYKNLL